MKKQALRQLIREEIRMTLNESDDFYNKPADKTIIADIEQAMDSIDEIIYNVMAPIQAAYEDDEVDSKTYKQLENFASMCNKAIDSLDIAKRILSRYSS